MYFVKFRAALRGKCRNFKNHGLHGCHGSERELQPRMNQPSQSFTARQARIHTNSERGNRFQEIDGQVGAIDPFDFAQGRLSITQAVESTAATFYRLFRTVHGAGLLISICALTFWICAACSLSYAARASIPFSCFATRHLSSAIVASCS